MGIIEDYVLAFKIVAVILVYYWVSSKVENKGVKIVLLLLACYYIFFMEWDLFGIIILFFALMMFTGVVNFVMDMVFQYHSVAGSEMEEKAMREMMGREQMGYLMGRFR